MLNYFISLFNRDKPSLTKYLLNYYSAPLTWISHLIIYLLLYFIKKLLSPLLKPRT
ncbi:hypothetical protein CONCODRAFT_14098 [Conidiobolus coronatus NRRL 28638]|uniref:Uncharacterized protein n=1 Tax=Conidiobolus coronatus (strain ATCC 28846 / CBS 209.66 / NRRL 28638) TaxID=796925 RepID=A0A137NPN4_CONC2|nr:hypothetical protein CONCODRAFT_14098 [Conidiobolus coronatus NRRL 28638]|eukprot:KXN64702.1 hypothetical protein CONCODRAFT_14098 [Conidiobolus coronatus NRRL 28638]